ncbi:MAG: hypothetical protein WCT99_07700 [Bacteroidota bacterium]|jgi:tetratricopeptide (TPR) repeat protein
MDTLEIDIEFLAQKLSENPESPLFARLADLYLGKNQTVEAMKLCEEGMKRYPEYTAGYLVLGKTHAALKEYSKALAAFRKAEEYSPFNPFIKKLSDAVAHQTDEPERTTDEDYFTQPAAETSAEEPPAAGVPLNASLFDGLTPEEMNYIQQTGESAPEQQPNTDLGYADPIRQNFSSFDEYYSEHQPQGDKASEQSLDDYLQSQQQAIPESESAGGTGRETPAETIAFENPVVEESGFPEQNSTEDVPVSAAAPEETQDNAPQEPEMVFASPEQAQLFAEMNAANSASGGLDELAEKLENAERIVPRENPAESASPEEPLDSDAEYSADMVTPTLAEIYASQGELKAAIQAYEILMFSHPEKGAGFQKRISELQQLQMEKDGLV